MKEITPQSFASSMIDAFTHRPPDVGPMEASELLRRLEITLNSLKEQTQPGLKGVRPPHVVACNCLCGALIRLSQAYGNAEVEAKCRELVAMATDITGI